MNKNIKYALLLILFSYLYFMFGNSIISLTYPDEVFYAQTAKEMVKHNSWMTPYLFDQPQFEKPIFLYWALRTAYIGFGIGPFAARFFPALFGIFGVLGVYWLGVIGLKNEKKAFIAALVLMSGGLYLGLARTVFTDMIFSVFIFFAMLSFYWGYVLREKRSLSIYLFYIFCALAVLTKGPLGFFIPFLAVAIFLFIRKEAKYFISKASFWGLLLFIALSFPWYILMIKKYGAGFVQEFFYNDHIRRLLEAEHAMNDTWYFYPVSIIGCMFPWSVFVAAALFSLIKNIRRLSPFYLFLAVWIGVVFIVFQPAHSKLTSYIFPLFAAVALLTGDFIYNAAFAENKIRLIRRLCFTSWFLLLAIPVGLVVNLKMLTQYTGSSVPAYLLIGLFAGWLLLLLIFLLRQKFFKFIYTLTLFIALFLVIIPLIHDDIEPYISSQKACDYLLKNYKPDNTILCSKIFARAVRYYTDKEVAVFGSFADNFFSPHPILFLRTDEETANFLKLQPITYCVLKKGNVADMERVLRGDFDRIMGQKLKFRVLEKIGNEYIVKIEPANPK